jgi:hypothetical protein
MHLGGFPLGCLPSRRGAKLEAEDFYAASDLGWGQPGLNERTTTCDVAMIVLSFVDIFGETIHEAQAMPSLGHLGAFESCWRDPAPVVDIQNMLCLWETLHDIAQWGREAHCEGQHAPSVPLRQRTGNEDRIGKHFTIELQETLLMTPNSTEHRGGPSGEPEVHKSIASERRVSVIESKTVIESANEAVRETATQKRHCSTETIDTDFTAIGALG